MAVRTANPMDVMAAFGIREGGIHFLDVDAAVGHLRMASLAGGRSAFIVSRMTGKAADALVDTDRRAVVAGADLRTPVICGSDGGGFGLARRMALVAEGLALVGTQFHGARSVGQLRERKQTDGEMHLLASIEDGERICRGRTRRRDARRRLGFHVAFAVHLVAGHAGHGGLVGEAGTRNVPGTSAILRLHQVADRSIEMHAVAAKAIVHQAAFGVVGWIDENLAVGRAMRPGMPRGVFMLMAFLAVPCHGEHVGVAESDRFRQVPVEMYADMTQLGGNARFMAIHTRCSAMR